MSLEKAIKIFAEKGSSDTQCVVDMIQRAESLDELKQIMSDEGTGSSADQFVSFRMSSLYKGDPEFAQRTLETAKEQFSKYGLPEEIVNYYISQGGGIDVALSTDMGIQSGKFGKLNMNGIKTDLEDFYKAANEYLFNTLRTYVTGS